MPFFSKNKNQTKYFLENDCVEFVFPLSCVLLQPINLYTTIMPENRKNKKHGAIFVFETKRS